MGNSSIICLRLQRGIPQALCNFPHIHQVLFVIIILVEWGMGSDKKCYHGESLILQSFYQITVGTLPRSRVQSSWLQQSPGVALKDAAP